MRPDVVPSAPSRIVPRGVNEPLPDAMFRRTLAPEEELVLLGARTRLGGARAQRFDELLSQGTLDWPRVLRVCEAHRVTGLVGRQLSVRSWRGVPTDVARAWGRYFGFITLQSRFLSDELGRVCAALEEAGVPVVSFKGPTLASALYGSGALRPCADLDLLVSRAQVLRAKALLGELGYEHEARLSPAQERTHLEVDSVFNLARPTPEAFAASFPQGLAVELHFAITSPRLPFALSFEHLAPRLGWERLPGQSVPVRTLAPLDLLFILLVHGAKHLWERLLWLCDIAELLAHDETLSGEEIVRAAREWRVERMTALGLSLTRDVMGAKLPREVETWLTTQPQALRLASHLRAQLFPDEASGKGKPSSSWPTTWSLAQAIDAPTRRLGFFWHVATTPSALDRQHLALPPALEPLWRVLGPFQKRASRNDREQADSPPPT